MSGQVKTKRGGIEALKHLLLFDWSIVRWVRLAIGLALLYHAITIGSFLFGLLSVFFLAQAIGNTGCCFASACASPASKKYEKIEEVEYEEIIKNKK